jgi:hypothetical protein
MLTHCNKIDSRAVKGARRDFLRRAVPLREWGMLTIPTNPGLLPVVGLDCRKRLDIVNLLRAGAQDRSFMDSHTAWSVLLDSHGNSLFVLRVQFCDLPNRAFTLAFTPYHRAFLNAIATVDVLVIIAGRITQHCPALRIDICSDELRQGLIMHDVLTRGGSRQAHYG